MSHDAPSVLVVEDHPVFTTALLHLLRNGNIDVKDVASTGEQAIEKLAHLQVDLVLVDISLPHMSGLELIVKLHELHPQLPCMVLSGHVATHYIQGALALGARGYVVKDNVEGIFEGIKRILQGEIYVGVGLAGNDDGESIK